METMTRRGFAGTALAGTLTSAVGWLGIKLLPEDLERELVWTTEDGRPVKIKDMADEHLRNCIHYQNRAFGAIHGRFYQHCASEEFPLYNAMRREASRRRLSWI
jgi:hypothetical protein